MSDRPDYAYPERVRHTIPEGDAGAYALAADFVNRGRYDVLSVQHEYGIFGGDAGCRLLHLVREAKMPIVTTLHTVLREPSESQRAVLDEVLQLSERVIVMSEKAVGFLLEVHHVPHEKIDLIPHGIPNIRPAVGGEFRAKLGIDGPMILTFGLLSPDKGIQYVIEAMPRIVAEHPGATYVVVGATHPNVRASAGESYRESLEALAKELGVAANVRFVNRFVETEELVEYLAAMDIYITPYLNPRQITSGTLAYAVGAGKAVISTPYWYAEELLDEGRGLLVPFRDAEALASAVASIQTDREATLEMGRRAAAYGKTMLWPAVGKSYLASFGRAKRDVADRLKTLVGHSSRRRAATVDRPPQVAETAGNGFARREPALPEMRLDHLFDLTDDTGMLQHASHTVPNRSEGYCVDDNARALLFTVLCESEGPLAPDVDRLQGRVLSFVHHAFNPKSGRFRNFMSYDRAWLEESGSEDSHGRSLWALGSAVRQCRDRGRRELAQALFEQAAPALLETSSLRTWAYGILALDEVQGLAPGESSLRSLGREMADRLWREFEIQHSDPWPWFEQRLTYANARLAQALMVAGRGLDNRAMLEAGLRSLDWLMGVQTGPEGVFAPIGSRGFYRRHERRSFFDQQPIEACASVSACLDAWRTTADEAWLEQARRAFRWFLGQNMLGQPVYDASTGGCCDGLHVERVNRNQGAESTLSFLCASAEMRLAQASGLSSSVLASVPR